MRLKTFILQTQTWRGEENGEILIIFPDISIYDIMTLYFLVIALKLSSSRQHIKGDSPNVSSVCGHCLSQHEAPGDVVSAVDLLALPQPDRQAAEVFPDPNLAHRPVLQQSV